MVREPLQILARRSLAESHAKQEQMARHFARAGFLVWIRLRHCGCERTVCIGCSKGPPICDAGVIWANQI